MLFQLLVKEVTVCGVVLLFSQSLLAHEEVVVKGRQVDLVGEASSASEGLVGQFELSVRPLSRIGEILETVPGMVATQHSGSGKANQYFLRGFNLDHGTDFATWYDNMPVNMRTHGHGQGYTDLNFIIPELVQEISYKKGSYYAEIGDFSAAGAAQLASFDFLNQGVAELGLGQDGYGRMLLMDTPDTKKHWLYALELHTYNGPWTDIDEDINKVNGVLKRHWDIGHSVFSITLMAYDNSWNSADQIPARAVDQGLIDELGSLDDSVGGESSRYSLSVRWDNESWNWSLYMINYNMNLWSNFTYFLDDPVNGDQFEQVDERIIYGGQLSYEFGYTTESKLGVEFRVDDIDEVGLYKTNSRNRLGVIRSDEVRESSLGVYWQSKIPLTESLEATIGARYDYYDFDVNSLIDQNINGVSLGINSGALDDSLFSIKGSLSYTVKEGLELYLSAGQGLHSNDARGSTVRVDPADGSAVDAVDPLVRSFGAEIGTRAFINEKLNASFALWILTLDSELLFVGDAGNTEATRESERDGFEATVYYNFNQNWAMDFEYALANAAFSKPDPGNPALGDHVPGSLDRVMSFGISLTPDAGWYGSLRWRFFGERPLDENDSVRSGNTSVFNLRAGYQWEKLKLTVDWLNLTDSDDHDIDYFYASRLNDEPADGFEDTHYHVIEPRTARLYLQYQF